MELKERPVVTQLNVVRERIRAIRKILNQSEQLRQKRRAEEYTTSNEGTEEDDETVYQAQKNLRELIDTLNSGKEDKYTNNMNSSQYSNNYNNEDYDDYSNDDYQQFESKEKKRQLATISVQKTAFRNESPKHHNSSKKKSKKSKKNDIFDQNNLQNRNKSNHHNNEYSNHSNRIFGLKNRKKNDYRLDYCDKCNNEYEYQYSDDSSSYVYCPVCSYKISKRSLSPHECISHQDKRKRNASATRKFDNHHIKISSESTMSSTFSDNYSSLKEYKSYEDDYTDKQINLEKKYHKSNSRSDSISTYYTDTSTLLCRYGTSPSASLNSSYNLDLTYSDDDLLGSTYLDDVSDESDVDVDEILHNVEKRRFDLSLNDDSYLNPSLKTKKANYNRKDKKIQKQKQPYSKNNVISLKPRYKFDDSISSSCSVLSDLLDEMSDEEKRLNDDNYVSHSSKKAKSKKQKQEDDDFTSQLNKQKQKKRKQAQKYSLDSLINEITSKDKFEEEEEFKFNIDNKNLNHILQNPLTKNSENSKDHKVQHTVKFILEEEEEETQNNAKISSGNDIININQSPNSPLLNIHEEEQSEDVFFNSNIVLNSKQKINVEEESLLELSDNSEEDIILSKQEFKQNKRNYLVEEEEEINQEHDRRKFSFSLTMSKEEEESLLDTKNHSAHDSIPKKQATSSSLYNDVDDIELDVEEEEEENDSNDAKENNQASEEESILIEMPQFHVTKDEEEEEVNMINHLKDEVEEDFEEDYSPEKFYFENKKLGNNEEINKIILNEEEDNVDQKSQHKLSDFEETGSVNIGDDDFM